ncbi:ribokinase [Demequina lutea]|uniref:Ribokinase n=1 Tax=Demequina lutea TaxID=431489 RepID=A0A7Z0CKD1_9MICO|nr:ribokinase [Demequina lutea]NYI41595.1 ribokinase [Demequina lutea]
MNTDPRTDSLFTRGPLIVLGTVNRDHVVFVDLHPLPGQTILGHSYETGTGGKGSNQAVSAARAGAAVTFVSAVGDDSAGAELLADLAAKGVNVSHVTRVDGQPSGVALITVSADGENSIIVAPGASASLDPALVSGTVADLVEPGSVLLTQLELPLPVVERACLVAHERGARVVLNLSPMQPVAEAVLAACDPLIVNAGEAATLAESRCESVQDAHDVAQALAARCRSVVVTLGGDGAVVADGAPARHFPGETVPVVDTTGAGDSFAGALAAALVAGAGLDDAVRSGIQASALTVQHVGAQPPEDWRP